MTDHSPSLDPVSTGDSAAVDAHLEIPRTGVDTGLKPWMPSSPQDVEGSGPEPTASPPVEVSSARSTRLRQVLGLWPGAFIVVVSLAFTLLLSQDEPVRTLAWLGLVASGVLAVIAWGSQPWSHPFTRPPSVWPFERVTPERALRLTGLGLTAILIWLGNSQFQAHQNEMFGFAGWLWLAGMALLVVSVAGWPLLGQHRLPRKTLKPNVNSAGSTTLPLGGLERQVKPAPTSLVPDGVSPYGGVVAEDATEAQPTRIEQPAWTSWEVALFLGIVVLSIALRVWDLTHFPYAIEGDEILTGRNAVQAYVNGNNPSIFTTLWDYIDLPALWFLGVAQSLKIGGLTLAALRLPAALFGAATVIPLYFLVRGVWGRAAAIAASAFMAFGVADIAFSRTTINNIVTPFFWTTCFLFLLRALRRGRPIDWVFAGLAGGLSEHFYYGTHLLPFILVGFALYLLAIQWRRARYYIVSFGLMALAYLAAFGPLLSTYLLRPNLYIGRSSGVLTWNHIPSNLEDLGNMWNTLWPLFARNLLTVSTLGGTDAFYAGPVLLPFEAALLVLGVSLLIRRWRHPASMLLLLSGLGVIIVGATLVPAAGNLNHWTPAFPTFYAALALPVAGIAWSAGRLLSKRGQIAAAALLAIGLVVLGALNISYYFNLYHVTPPEHDVRAAKARFQADIGSGYVVRSVGRTSQPYDPETTGYLVKGIDGGQIMNPASELPVPIVTGKGLAFTFFPDQAQYINQIELMYPGGTHGQINSAAGSLIFDYYLLSPELAAREYGANLQVLEADGKTVRYNSRVTRIGDIEPGATYPLHARWTAYVYLPQSSAYNLSVVGPSTNMLFDGQASRPWTDNAVQPGWHQVTVDAELSAPVPVKLMVAEASQPAAEAPTERLWPTVPGSGLLATVPGDINTAPPLVRTDPYIGFTDLQTRQWFGPSQGAGSPFRVRWAGEIRASLQGNYQFEVRTNGVARLTVDGATLVRACPVTEPAPVAGNIDLPKGWHSIQLDYQAIGYADTLELYWVTPAGERSLVPPAALRFAPDTQAGATTPPAPPVDVICLAP